MSWSRPCATSRRTPLARLLLRLAALDRLAGARGRPRVRQEPVWRLRTARAVAVTCLAIIAVVLVISAVHRESPLRPLQPVTSRIHIGTDNDATQATGGAEPRPDRILARSRRRNRRGRSRSGLSAGRRLAGAGALALAVACRTRARRWRRSSPRSGNDCRSSCAKRASRRLPHLRRRPAPAGHPGGAGDPAGGQPAATFFLAGEQVEQRPALAAEIVAAGHRVELHCHRHRNQLRLTPRAMFDDADAARAAIEDATGQAIADYRPPYGIFSGAGLRRSAHAAGGRCSGRSGGGTGRAGPLRRRSRARRPTGSAGDIVLLHDADFYSARNSWERTASALPRILEELDDAGLKSSVLRR